MRIAEEFKSSCEDEEINFNYFYRLIESEYKGNTVYGIEIERKDYIGIKNINIIRDRIDKISYKEEEAKGILVNLYKNNLSPIHLIEVAGEYADDFSYKADNYLNWLKF